MDGSSGVLNTLRMSSVPSGATATRSVNVPPTSTPTLIRTRMQNAECRMQNAQGSNSSFCIHHSALSGPVAHTVNDEPANHHKHRCHRQPPHPVAPLDVQRPHVARHQLSCDDGARLQL